MFRYFPIVLANAVRNRRRTILTILSVAASICLLAVLGAIYRAFYFTDATPEQALRLVVRNRVSLGLPMPAYYAQQIKQVPGVREVMYQQWFGGIYKDSRNPDNFFARFGIEPDKLFTIRGDIRLPEDQKRAFLSDRAGCIIGKPLAERHGFKAGDRIQIRGDIFPVDLDMKIHGIFDGEPNNTEILYFNILTLWESPNLPERRKSIISQFAIRADSPDSVDRIASAIDTTFQNAPFQTKTESEHQFQLSFIAFLGNVKVFLFSVCGAVTFTILLVTANTMAMSVRERVREVGILKTLGYRPGVILGMILGEAGLISIAGGVLGCALASGLCALVRSGPARGFGLNSLGIDPLVGGAAILVALLIGTLSSLVPAWGASRTGIIEALRSTG